MPEAFLRAPGMGGSGRKLQGLGLWPQNLRSAVMEDSISLHRWDSNSDKELRHLRAGDDGVNFTHSGDRTKLLSTAGRRWSPAAL